MEMVHLIALGKWVVRDGIVLSRGSYE